MTYKVLITDDLSPQSLARLEAAGRLVLNPPRAIETAVDEVIKANPKAVADYKAGKILALGALVGAVMKKLGGKANAAVVSRMLTERMA